MDNPCEEIMYSKGKPSVEVTVEDNFSMDAKRYQISWWCEGNKAIVTRMLANEVIYKSYEPHEMIVAFLQDAMQRGVYDLHGTENCNWCVHARYGLAEIILKEKSKTAYHHLMKGKTSTAYIADGTDEWQELGYTSVDGIQFGPKYHSDGSIEAGNVTAGSLTGDALSVSETMKKMQQQIHYTSQVMGGWNHPNNAPAEAVELAQKSHELPGVSIKVKYPCADNCSLGQFYSDEGGRPIRSIIMHLNDVHKWTREAIADWLDSVDDPENGIDLAFKVPEKEES